jgi:hypothetical protein
MVSKTRSLKPASARGTSLLALSNGPILTSFHKIIQEGLLPKLGGPLEMGFPPMFDKVTPGLTTETGFIG